MAIKQGKAGTKRVVGLQRAQLVKVEEVCDALVAYNAKLLLRIPPVAFLAPADVTVLENASLVAQRYQDQLNV